MLFFAAITCAAAPRFRYNIRGVAEYGEKRWRTDQVGSPDSDLQGHGPVTKASVVCVRFTQRHHQEEPARQRPLHDARSHEAEGCEEACDQAARRYQPLHW